jgi:hypothetical protein
MCRTGHLSILLAVLAFSPAFANAETVEEREQQLDILGTDDADIGNIVNLDDVSTVLNPLQKLVKGWPEDLVVAPIPAYSAQLGWSLTLGGGYFFDIGDESPESRSSVVGGFAMKAENGSYAYGAGTYLHLLDDKLRIKGGGAFMDIRYRFFGVGYDQADQGLKVDILQDGGAYFASASWNVWKKLYVGLGYLRGNVNTRLRLDSPALPFFDPTLNLDLGAFTIPIEIDSRDHEQFPRNGWLLRAKTILYRDSAGSDFDAETFEISANHYAPMRERDVLATRFMVKDTSSGIPFFLLSSFGGKTDLRGYVAGRYRDQTMYAVQTEYRWVVSDRWILTGFVGVGEVASDFSNMGENFLPAGGIGARFVLSDKHKVGLSADIAVGKHGAEFYFGVGEAF